MLGESDDCIALYLGDWAPALIALDARVEVLGRSGKRTLAFADLHRLPGTTPHVETNLIPGELITAFVVPGGPRRRSLYRKIRDRESYAFANASAAVAIDLDGEIVRDVHRVGRRGDYSLARAARRGDVAKTSSAPDEVGDLAKKHGISPDRAQMLVDRLGHDPEQLEAAAVALNTKQKFS